MKTIALIVLLITTQIGFAGLEKQAAKTEKYHPQEENTVVLPMPFAGDVFIDDSQINLLKGKEIHLVELVYTAFKSSSSFDQNQLNEERMNELKELLPWIEKSTTNWVFVEQTGAKTSEIAKSYFHGFVIHYADDLDYQSLKSFYSDFQTPFLKKEMKNSKGGEMISASGTRISLLPNSVVHADGSLVQGEFTISYREYRDPAEIAFSGIPMTFQSRDVDYNFASVGMYELRAEKDGETLKLNQPAKVDFVATQKKEEVGFYQMDDQGNWKKVHDIRFDKNKEDVVERDDLMVIDSIPFNNGGKVEVSQRYRHRGKVVDVRVENEISKFTMNEKAWTRCLKLHAKFDTVDQMILSKDAEKKELEVNSIYRYWLVKKICNRRVGGHSRDLVELEVIGHNGRMDIQRKAVPNDQRSTLLGAGSKDPGHTYPTLVKGLNSPDFGVYNCDQIYRIGRSLAIRPIYQDVETGEEISNKHVACVLDLDYNGAFSFHPSYVNCNLESRNAILLFTKDKKVYLLEPDEFALLDEENRQPILQMKNVTTTIKNANDLRDYLSI